MSERKTYAVFGLGVFGISVARELEANGEDVLAVDIDEEVVEEMASELSVCRCADVTSAEALEELGISDIDVVIISMASNIEASILAIMLCREAGVSRVIAKCANELHRKIMYRVGADQVVLPETESGVRLARNIVNTGFMDILDLSKNASIEEIEMKPEWEGKSLAELKLRQKYSINIIAINEDNNVMTDIDPEMKLNRRMRLIAIAEPAKLKGLR